MVYSYRMCLVVVLYFGVSSYHISSSVVQGCTRIVYYLRSVFVLYSYRVSGVFVLYVSCIRFVCWLVIVFYQFSLMQDCIRLVYSIRSVVVLYSYRTNGLFVLFVSCIRVVCWLVIVLYHFQFCAGLHLYCVFYS